MVSRPAVAAAAVLVRDGATAAAMAPAKEQGGSWHGGGVEENLLYIYIYVCM